MASNIKKYTKKDGTTAYMFRKYLGIDPDTGRQRETTRRGFATIKEAKMAYSRLELEFDSMESLKKVNNRTYFDVFEEWYELVYKHTVKESTFANTRIVFDKHVLPVFGHRKLKDITVSFCQKKANAIAVANPNRYKRYLNYAGMVFKYAVSINVIDTNPFSKIIIPVIKDDEDEEDDDFENFYEKEDLIYFLKCMKNKYAYQRYAFFFLIAYTGLRKGEVLALTWKDINLKNKTLSVTKTLATGKNSKLIIQKPKTKNSIREISLDPSTIEVLMEWKQRQRIYLGDKNNITKLDQLVFCKEDRTYHYPRTPLSWLDSFYNKHRSMQRITVHGFRHTHASLLFAAGANMKQVQARLGHASIKTTMNVYTHVTQVAKEETALIFENFMNNEKSLGQSLGQTKIPTNN